MQSNSATDLSIRESILQVLKTKATNGGNIVHSSDFRTAITELGYPMGSTLIENVLVYCKLDIGGYIDFSELERRLQHERKLFNSQMSFQSHQPAHSSNIKSPIKVSHDLEYLYKVESDRQLNKVTENSNFVKELYLKLGDHEIDANEAARSLLSINIVPTQEFFKLSQKMKINNVPYAEFIFSLTKPSQNGVDDKRGEVAAGGYMIKPELTGESIGSFRKRTVDQHPSLHCTAKKVILQHKSGHDVFKDDLISQPKPMRKMMDPTNSGAKYQNAFQANQVREVLFGSPSNNNNNNKAVKDNTVCLFSTAQQSLINGTYGKDVRATFTIEQKLQREQISAALRKLDANQITFFDFHDLVKSMGITVPDNVLIDIKRSFQAGYVDVRKYSKLLDAAVFKVTAVDDYLEINDKLSLLRKKFKDAILGRTKSRTGIANFYSPHHSVNCNVLNDFRLVFSQMDEDNNGLLTFTEFQNVCIAFNITDLITATELKQLFHSLDRNGDGLLSFDEFIYTIRGEVSSYCIQSIQKVFRQLDRYSDGKILIDTIFEDFCADFHPLVKNGYFTRQQVSADMRNYFSLDKNSSSGFVHYDSFETYFSNIAAAIDSEDAFLKMMKECWSLSDHAPPPAVSRLRHGTDRIDKTPMAIQNHGDFISWQQESSILEDTSKSLSSQKGKKKNEHFYERNSHTDVISWVGHENSAELGSQEAIQTELKASGVACISKGLKNQNSLSQFLEWDDRQDGTPNSQYYQPPLISKTIFPVDKVELPAQIRYQRKPGPTQQSSFRIG